MILAFSVFILLVAVTTVSLYGVLRLMVVVGNLLGDRDR